MVEARNVLAKWREHHASIDILDTARYLETVRGVNPEMYVFWRIVSAVPTSAAQIERDQGRACDLITLKRSCLHPAFVEMVLPIATHNTQRPIDISKVKELADEEASACMPQSWKMPPRFQLHQESALFHF